jgi:hypothetical protein
MIGALRDAMVLVSEAVAKQATAARNLARAGLLLVYDTMHVPGVPASLAYYQMILTNIK